MVYDLSFWPGLLNTCFVSSHQLRGRLAPRHRAGGQAPASNPLGEIHPLELLHAGHAERPQVVSHSDRYHPLAAVSELLDSLGIEVVVMARTASARHGAAPARHRVPLRTRSWLCRDSPRSQCWREMPSKRYSSRRCPSRTRPSRVPAAEEKSRPPTQTHLCETNTTSTRLSSSRVHGAGRSRWGARRDGIVRSERAGSVRIARESRVTYDVDWPSCTV
jgi:hypothetical protein